MLDTVRMKVGSAIMKDQSFSHGERNHLGKKKRKKKLRVPSENKATDAEPLRDRACQPRV